MTAMTPETAPRSPCILVCQLDDRRVCRGCHRTLEEIAGWVRMTAAEQWAVIRACDERRAADQRTRTQAATSIP